MNIILFPPGQRRFDREDPRAQHIIKVLHLRAGDSFTAGEFNGMRGHGMITSLDDGAVSFDFHAESDDAALQPLTVLLAMVRPICMRRILRELSSMGVGRIVLTSSQLGEKSYREAGLYKDGEYAQILVDGAMQGGHTGLPEVVFASSAKEAIGLCADDGAHLLLDNVIGAVGFSDLDLRGRHVTLAIGPERGWSDEERSLFLSAAYEGVLIGHHILRTETAAVAAPSLALLCMGLI